MSKFGCKCGPKASEITKAELGSLKSYASDAAVFEAALKVFDKYNITMHKLAGTDVSVAEGPVEAVQSLKRDMEALTKVADVPIGKGGTKFDAHKAPLDLIPYEALLELGKVLAAGEVKYGTANWAEGIKIRRLLAASMRHMGQFNAGEDYDQETQTLHLANAAVNMLFAIWMMKNRPDLDDRWSKKIEGYKFKSQD